MGFLIVERVEMNVTDLRGAGRGRPSSANDDDDEDEVRRTNGMGGIPHFELR